MQDLRDEIIIDNGTKDFPIHLTVSKINYKSLSESRLSYELKKKDLCLNSFDWSIKYKCNNYFQSIYLVPRNKKRFNNILLSAIKSSKLGENFIQNINPHISLVYSFIKKEKVTRKENLNISFDKFQIAFVNENKRVWKYVNTLKGLNL